MDVPIKAFDIIGKHGEKIELEILQVYGFPKETSFRGGYDINCRLKIVVGKYKIETYEYLSSTGCLYNFFIALKEIYEKLNGECVYKVLMPDNELIFKLTFIDGQVNVKGYYRDDPMLKNILEFEFDSDQSYFPVVLQQLKSIVNIFGDNKGKR